MKLSHRLLQSFTDKDFNTYKAVLVYGQDQSLVVNLIARLKSNFLRLHNIETRHGYDTKFINGNLHEISTALFSFSLLQPKQFILVQDIEKLDAAQLKTILLDARNRENCVVFQGLELPAYSKIRQLFDNERNLASVVCYKLEEIAAKKMLTEFFKQKAMSNVPSTMIEQLTKSLPDTYGGMLQYLEKIDLFLENNQDLSQRAVQEFCNYEYVCVSIDEFINLVVTLNIEKAVNALDVLIDNEQSGVSVIRNMQNYFIKILQAKSALDSGQSMEEAIAGITPKIFWKNLETFKKAITLFDKHAVVSLLYKLSQIETKYKKTNIDPRHLLSVPA